MTSSPRQRTLRQVCSCFVLIACLGQISWTAEPAPLSNRTISDSAKRAIDLAAGMLLKKMRSETDAFAALEALALLKIGYTLENSEIRDVCTRICKRVENYKFVPGGNFIYEAGVSLMCLANADSKKFLPQIKVIAQFIIDNQSESGHWHYERSNEGDTSISQYAVLGLWEAARSGVEIPLEVWDRTAQWHLKTQQRDGGFAYHPDVVGGVGQSLHSMTAAGIGSLQVARLYLYPNAKELLSADQLNPKKRINKYGRRFGILTPVFRQDEVAETSEAERIASANSSYVRKVKLAQIDDGIRRAIDWMTERFTVSKPTGYPIYFLYGLERAATLSHKEMFGDHDWYDEGAAHLIATQGVNHSWLDSCGEGPCAAFGILFLSRATSKMVHQAPRVAFGTGILVGGRGLPDDLKATAVNDGKVKTDEKKKTPVEELLAALESPQAVLVETAQTEIVERIVIGDRNALIGQIDRLKKLTSHPEAEVRRTAMWALGRSGDLRLSPYLIKGLEDLDIDVYIEARNGLRCLSRSVEDFQPQDAPLDADSRKAELAKWRAWYREIREYDERDDLVSKRPPAKAK